MVISAVKIQEHRATLWTSKKGLLAKGSPVTNKPDIHLIGMEN